MLLVNASWGKRGMYNQLPIVVKTKRTGGRRPPPCRHETHAIDRESCQTDFRMGPSF